MNSILNLTLAALVLMTVQSAMANDIEKIIGKNDLVAVNAEATNIPEKFRSLVNAFGKLGMGCTATHIGDGYVLTAGHCFWAGPEPMKDADCSGTENEIQWGFREGKQPYMTSRCERIILAQRTEKMDYALLKVSPVPPVAVKADWQKRAKLNEKITIFSHPEELPLRWSQYCKVRKIQQDDFDQALIHHHCDTNPGSSGATIINAYTLKVVGIHDGGKLDGDGSGLNYGTYIYDTPLRKMLQSLKIK
jgi:V8-like Glu-specific endopeptidase